MQYHINRKGVAAPCRAKKTTCPLGAAFDSKEGAREAAVELEKEYLGIDKDVYKKTKEDGNYSELTKHLGPATEKDLEPLNSEIQKYRNNPVEKSMGAEHKSMNKLNELVNIKNRELMDGPDGKKVAKIRSKMKEIDEELKGGPNFDRKREKEALIRDLSSEMKRIQEKATVEASKTKEYKSENKVLQEIRKEESIRRYIESHSKSEDGLTPIEREYQNKKNGKQELIGINKDIGVNKLSMRSTQLHSGANEIKEDLVVDSKGRIANLYVDYNGTTKRVIALNEDKSGNIEFDDGTKLTLSEGSNFKNSGLTQINGINFHTTPPRGKKKYEGYNKIIFNKFDSGD